MPTWIMYKFNIKYCGVVILVLLDVNEVGYYDHLEL